MALNFQVILENDLDEILDYEKNKLSESIMDEAERTLSSWHARWRPEALRHYLPLGWSFLARDEGGKLVGYFIAQPMLFLDGQTQTLWVEHVQYSSLEARDQLVDLAYRLSREKHFQKVLFPNANSLNNSLKSMKSEAWQPAVIEVKTTKV